MNGTALQMLSPSLEDAWVERPAWAVEQGGPFHCFAVMTLPTDSIVSLYRVGRHLKETVPTARARTPETLSGPLQPAKAKGQRL